MKRYLIVTGFALAALMGCRDRADTLERNDTTVREHDVTTGDRYDRDVKTDSEFRQEVREDTNKVETEFDQLKKDVDEEFLDRNEPGDQWKTETDSVKGGESGAKDTLGGKVDRTEDKAKSKTDKAKQDVDEEFRDTTETGDKAGGETDTYEGGKR